MEQIENLKRWIFKEELGKRNCNRDTFSPKIKVSGPDNCRGEILPSLWKTNKSNAIQIVPENN